jgi:uncharacterized protein YceH (UPF0502 family)
MQIDKTARRVLGSLIEKQWTTPEQYPLTQNALVLACNQKSNRDPEMQLEEFIVAGCLQQLRFEGLISIVERDVGRTLRYAERLSEKLDLSRQDQAIVAELMLRGPQTSTELHRRCSRMADFKSPEEIEGILQGMAAKHWTKLLPREPREKYPRWTHLFAPANEVPDAPAPSDPSVTQIIVDAAMSGATPRAAAPADDVRAELLALREEVAELRARVARLEGGDPLATP